MVSDNKQCSTSGMICTNGEIANANHFTHHRAVSDSCAEYSETDYQSECAKLARENAELKADIAQLRAALIKVALKL